MKLLRRILLGLLVLVLLFALLLAGGAYVVFVGSTFPRTQGTLPVAGVQSRVQVRRDTWGVPHIYAANEHDLFFAQGYVHAQDRLWQMEFNRRVAAGRLSEILGESTLDSDRFLRTMGLYRAAQADLRVLPAEVLDTLQAYVDGVNAFISTHQNQLPLEFTLLQFRPEPWTISDTVAWGKVMAMSLSGNWSSELVRQQLIAALGEGRVRELLPPYSQDGPFIIPAEARSYGRLDTSLLDEYQQVIALTGMSLAGQGSNNWVVDGTRTATGRPLLANDPHLGIQMPSIWYEVHLVAGELDVAGASFPGTPGVVIGHNRDIAWGVTNAGPDTQDLYVEKINPADPNQYEFRGQWEDMTVIEQEIAVKGRTQPDKLTVRLTRHGPLMTAVISDATEPLALRWAALEGGGLFHSLYLLDRARNWAEFRAALRYWQAPSQNFVYADRNGNIGYQMPGDVPIRAKGQGLVPVPGWTGEYEWTGYIPFDELPFVYNPPTHYIVTANNKVVPDDYPYFLSAEWAEPSRARRISDLIQETGRLTVDDMRNIQADTYSIPASKLMPYVLALGPEGWLQDRAFNFLRSWDLSMEKEGGAAGITEAILWRMLVNTYGDELEGITIPDHIWASTVTGLFNIVQERNNPWFDDVRTPGVEDRDAILRRSVSEAMEFWRRRFGDLVGNLDSQWAWGKVHTATFAHVLGAVRPLDLLLNRGPVPVSGSWCTVDATAYRAGDFAVATAPSYRQIIDVGEWRNSRSQHTTGQSGQPLHKHYDDMIRSWAAVQHHPMLYEPEDIVAHQEGLLTLVPQ